MDKQSKFTLRNCTLCSKRVLTFFGELPSGYNVHNCCYSGTLFFQNIKEGRIGHTRALIYRQGVFNQRLRQVICEDCDKLDSRL